MGSKAGASLLAFTIAFSAVACDSSGDSNIGGRQLVAMLPNLGRVPQASERIQWVELRWPAGASSVSEVLSAPADFGDPEVTSALGAWAHLSFGSLPGTAPALTCRLDPPKERMVCLAAVNTTISASDRGCCSDTLQIHKKASGRPQTNPVLGAVRAALREDGIPATDAETAFLTHTFDLLGTGSGELQALLVIRYMSSELGGCFADAYVLVLLLDDASSEPEGGGMPNVRVVPTQQGRKAFVTHRDIGTMDTSSEATAWKVQHLQSGSRATEEQWHANGVLRFTDKAGRHLFGLTHRGMREAVVLADPWIGPGGPLEILQRFGTPPLWTSEGRPADVSPHFFGALEAREGPQGLEGGVHNLWYQRYEPKPGRPEETLTIFCNSQGEDGLSKVYEFELNLQHQHCSGDPAFPAAYSRVSLDISAGAQGGARVLTPGLYISTTGFYSTGHRGLEVLDLHGGVLQIPLDQRTPPRVLSHAQSAARMLQGRPGESYGYNDAKTSQDNGSSGRRASFQPETTGSSLLLDTNPGLYDPFVFLSLAWRDEILQGHGSGASLIVSQGEEHQHQSASRTGTE